jgi:hypothetical protein
MEVVELTMTITPAMLYLGLAAALMVFVVQRRTNTVAKDGQSSTNCEHRDQTLMIWTAKARMENAVMALPLCLRRIMGISELVVGHSRS